MPTAGAWYIASVVSTKNQANWTLSEEELEKLRKERGDHSTHDLTVQDLDVVFQPLVDLTTGQLYAVEALVRCRWEEYRNPEIFIETAAEEGSIGKVGRLIRDVAFERCRDLPIFVNVHPKELSSRWLVRPDDPINFHSEPVFIEITESAAFEYFGLCSSVMQEICSRSGAKLVIDDLGAGFSNLKRVIDLEPSIVKLDRELVRGLDVNPRQRVLFQHVVRMCKELGASVVAEGIETVAELEAVRKAGADYGQGYLMARPSYPIPKHHWPLAEAGRASSP
ncbi:MAG: Phytochrome-like protein cph2 [Deltaproteobacteria bacterium ADurb.Bin207]|nr:MAG: Phytochrome-like protein cph2 [Deltaproteobacteria bacterium ADurb.Bin207]